MYFNWLISLYELSKKCCMLRLFLFSIHKNTLIHRCMYTHTRTIHTRWFVVVLYSLYCFASVFQQTQTDPRGPVVQKNMKLGHPGWWLMLLVSPSLASGTSELDQRGCTIAPRTEAVWTSRTKGTPDPPGPEQDDSCWVIYWSRRGLPFWPTTPERMASNNHYEARFHMCVLTSVTST